MCSRPNYKSLRRTIPRNLSQRARRLTKSTRSSRRRKGKEEKKRRKRKEGKKREPMTLLDKQGMFNSKIQKFKVKKFKNSKIKKYKKLKNTKMQTFKNFQNFRNPKFKIWKAKTIYFLIVSITNREGSSNTTPKKKNSNSTKLLSEFAEVVKSKMKGTKEGSANNSRPGSVNENIEKKGLKGEGSAGSSRSGSVGENAEKSNTEVKGLKGEGSASSSRFESVSESAEKNVNEGEKMGARANSEMDPRKYRTTMSNNNEGEKMGARANSEMEPRKPNVEGTLLFYISWCIQEFML
jgi:hypothetical protein